jgi:hypothetical protein
MIIDLLNIYTQYYNKDTNLYNFNTQLLLSILTFETISRLLLMQL